MKHSDCEVEIFFARGLTNGQKVKWEEFMISRTHVHPRLYMLCSPHTTKFKFDLELKS